MTAAKGSLEEFLRAMLRGDLNGTGRAIEEYRLIVERRLDGDVLAIAMVPVGFEGMAQVFAITDNTLVPGEAAVAFEVESKLAIRANEAKILDLEQAGRDQAALDEAAKVEMAAKKAAKNAESPRPGDSAEAAP